MSRPMFPEQCLDATNGDALGALDLAVRIVRRRELENGVLVEASIDDLHDETPVSDFERLELLERELLAAGVIRFS